MITQKQKNPPSLPGLTFVLPEKHTLAWANTGGYILGERPRRQLELTGKNFDLVRQALEGKDHKFSGQEVAFLLTLGAKGYLEIEPRADALDFLAPEDLPKVAVIIPVKDRPAEIADCLNSLAKVVWAKEKLSIIVVDDGSTDETPTVAKNMGAKVVANPVSLGPSAARNLGAETAKAEGCQVLAFLDSDCTVEPSWLQELMPWLLLQGVGAVGGKVAGFYQSKKTDRYEGAMSSLSMGKRLLYESKGVGNFYVPTCNLLVWAEAYHQVSGLNPAMHLGEDVDLCWRLRDRGYGLVYAPWGKAWHKHRSQAHKMLKRKLEYGTSEADLYKRHGDKKKRFPLPLTALVAYVGVLLALGLFNPWFLLLTAGGFMISLVAKARLARKLHSKLNFVQLLGATARNILAFCYYLNYHIIRYYLILFLVLGIFAKGFWLVAIIAAVSCSVVDYVIKKPKLDYFSFAYYYLLEQIYYQIGVFVGCIKHRYFKCYLVKWLIRT